MSEHTPTPWHASRKSRYVSDINHRVIAEISPLIGFEANAAFIVKAVNSHDDLVKTLQRMTQAFKPFTSKPIGAEGSAARLEQQEQISAHVESTTLLRRLGAE